MAISVRITVSVPDEVLNSARIRSEMERTLKTDVGNTLRSLFEQTVEGWKSPPYFVKQFFDDGLGSRLGMRVYASGRNAAQYALVNGGARRHWIFPRNAPFLRFQTGYSASTRPRVLRSQAYVRSGPYVTSRGVDHPGFEAREFDETVAEEYGDGFAGDIYDAIDRATT